MAKRQFVVSRADARKTLAEWLHRRLALAWSQARQLVKDGGVRIDDRPCLDSTLRLQRGQRLEVEVSPPASGGRKPPESARASGGHKPPESTALSGGLRPPLADGPVIRFIDAHVVVVDKPAGLTTVRHAREAAEFGARGQRFLPPTLAGLLPPLVAEARGGKPPRVRAVHRLDKDTSGLVVFALTAAAESHLGKQFRAHTTERRYLAVVRGPARDATLESFLVDDRGDGRRGSGPQEEGQRAVTHVRVLECVGDYTLVECRLETGRTHQVRIHLGEAGTPLCGEHVYDRSLHGKPLPDGSGAARIALHAASLGFDHPATGERVRWTAPLPADMKALLERLRGQPRPQDADNGGAVTPPSPVGQPPNEPKPEDA